MTMQSDKRERRKKGEVRGVENMLISRGLQFLDMNQQGYADFGKIKDAKAPEEFTTSGVVGYGAVLLVLGKFDPDLKKSFSTSLSEKLTPEVSAWTKWFLRVTIVGTLGGIFTLLGLEFLRLFGIIPTDIAFPLLIAGFGIVITLFSLVAIYAFMNDGKDPPQGVLDAISEPQVRFEAERAFEKIVDIFQELAEVLVTTREKGNNY